MESWKGKENGRDRRGEGRTGEAGGHLNNDAAGDGESDEEGPVAVKLPLEEHGPRIERLHLSR